MYCRSLVVPRSWRCDRRWRYTTNCHNLEDHEGLLDDSGSTQQNWLVLHVLECVLLDHQMKVSRCKRNHLYFQSMRAVRLQRLLNSSQCIQSKTWLWKSLAKTRKTFSPSTEVRPSPMELCTKLEARRDRCWIINSRRRRILNMMLGDHRDLWTPSI